MDQFLFRFFQRIRQALGIELGLGEYMLLQEAFEQGYDPLDTEVVFDLCRKLWLKSREQENAFRQLFEQEAVLEIQLLRKKLQHIQLAEARKQQEKRSKEDANRKTKEDTPTEKPKPTPDEIASFEQQAEQQKSELKYEVEEVQVRFPQQQNHESEEDQRPVFTRKFLMSGNYHPMTEREMKQNFRFLRNKVAVGESEEININATVKKAAQRALFEKIVFQQRFENKLQLLLFIDIGSTMVAFHSLGQQLVRSAQKGGGQAHAQVYYYKGAPTEFVYKNREATQQVALSSLLSSLNRSYTNAIIFSDGGAASIKEESDRSLNNWDFLDQLIPNVLHTVWLNPMPEARWKGTDAEMLGNIVPMCELNRLGFSKAIRILRGKKTAIE